jgi:hypothetical protein
MAMENDRLDRVERILEEMAVRQQYHDEAFERFDVEMKEFRTEMTRLEAVVANDTENIQALLRIAEMHDRRLNNLEGPV